MKKLLSAFILVAAASCAGGPSSSSSSGGNKTPETACSDLCTQEGFTSSSVMVETNETNCFCSGGSGTMTDGHCTAMCDSIGKDTAQTFGSGTGPKDACQCS